MKPESKLAANLFSVKTTDFQYLQDHAANSFESFLDCLKDLREMFPLPDGQMWEWDDENLTFRKVKLPEMEWLDFEEPNDELL
jgi:hypothetical protein